MELNMLMFNCCKEKGVRGKGKGRGRRRMILYQEKSMRWRHESFVPSTGISVQMPFVSQVQYLVVFSMTLVFRDMYFFTLCSPWVQIHHFLWCSTKAKEILFNTWWFKGWTGKFWLYLIFSYLHTVECKSKVKCKFTEFGLGFEKYSIAVTR